MVSLQYISKSLHAKFDHIANEPLPKRWVELIHYLNEKEQREKRPPPRAAGKNVRNECS